MDDDESWMRLNLWFLVYYPEAKKNWFTSYSTAPDLTTATTNWVSRETKKNWTSKCSLVGGFNPFEKYESNWVHLPNFRGENVKKSLSCHHLFFQCLSSSLSRPSCCFPFRQHFAFGNDEPTPRISFETCSSSRAASSGRLIGCVSTKKTYLFMEEI